MKLDEAIEILENWIEIDRRMRDFPDVSDYDKYDKFCEERNIAIERVLNEIPNAYEQGFKDGANSAATDILGRV